MSNEFDFTNRDKRVQYVSASRPLGCYCSCYIFLVLGYLLFGRAWCIYASFSQHGSRCSVFVVLRNVDDDSTLAALHIMSCNHHWGGKKVPGKMVLLIFEK